MENGKIDQDPIAPVSKPTATKDGKLALASLAARLLVNGCAGTKSFVASPACLYATLETLARGAEGETLSELELALGSEKARRSACKTLFPDDHGQVADGHPLNIAASIWANRSNARLRPSFSRALADINGKASEVDLGSPEAKAQMSSWLSENTGGKFACAPDISPDSVFAIIGALHFKDTWVDRLDDEELEMPFNAPDSKPTVTMMSGLGDCGHLLNDCRATAVSWPMMSGASAVFAMPEEGIGIEAFIESGDAWNAISRCHDREGTVRPDGGIELLVPEFELKSDSHSLVSTLQAMGVKRAFEPGAELEGITEADSMVDEILQSTVLKLDPDGVEGAAYTLMVACAGCLPEFTPEPVRIVFDRPFAFAVFSHSGAPLFVGAYTGK